MLVARVKANLSQHEQLDWLAEQLETYKDRRVYLYFHTFLNAPEGNPLLGEGNLINEMVHVSSVAAPRTTGLTEPFQTSNPLKMSEGLYNTVYEDFIITNACDFVSGSILAYAVYKIDK